MMIAPAVLMSVRPTRIPPITIATIAVRIIGERRATFQLVSLAIVVLLR